MAEKLNRIGEVLKKQGITAYKLHKDSGVAYALVSAYVKNTRQPSLATLKKVSSVLGVPGKELINF